MLITSEFRSSNDSSQSVSTWHRFRSFHSLVCSWQPPLVFMNWPFNPTQPQLMQTTQGIRIYTRQLHKHKHVLTFTAVIEVEDWKLGRVRECMCIQGCAVTTCDSRHVLGIILGVRTHRIWYYFCAVIINRLISSERMDRVFWTALPFLKLHTRCWGHRSCLIFAGIKEQWNYRVWLQMLSVTPPHSCRYTPSKMFSYPDWLRKDKLFSCDAWRRSKTLTNASSERKTTHSRGNTVCC